MGGDARDDGDNGGWWVVHGGAIGVSEGVEEWVLESREWVGIISNLNYISWFFFFFFNPE